MGAPRLCLLVVLVIGKSRVGVRSALIRQDPRKDSKCRDVYTSAEPGIGEYAQTPPDTPMVIREDLRLDPSHNWPHVPTEYDQRMVAGKKTASSGVVLHGQFTRKVGSRLGQLISRALVEIGTVPTHLPMDQRAVFSNQQSGNNTTLVDRIRVWSIVRDPWSKIVSAYREVIKHSARCSKTRKMRWICSRPWNNGGMSTVSEPVRFEAFVDDVLFGPFNYTHDDTASYHAFSQMLTFRRIARLDYLVHMESLRDDLKEMLTEVLPPAVVESAAVAKMLDTYVPVTGAKSTNYAPPQSIHFEDAASRRSLKPAHVPEAIELRFEDLSARTRAQLMEYFKQDYDCLGYARPASPS
jgi:hypothetical protein